MGTRKINIFATPQMELKEMLTRELHLSPDWQKLHLTLERMEEQPPQEVQGHGDSLPGLRTRFRRNFAWMVVNDVNAPGCNGILGLPGAEDFETAEEKNTGSTHRYWTWSPQDE